MIEMPCLQWGFYLNATKSDFGPDDLYCLADFIVNKTLEDSVSANIHFCKEHDPAILSLSPHDAWLLLEDPRLPLDILECKMGIL